MIRTNLTLRHSAKEAPHCMSCFMPNPNGDLIVLAHNNELAMGRGAYHKTPDLLGALVCNVLGGCHDQIDGRAGNLTKEEKHEKQRTANMRSLAWWWENGYLVAVKPKA